MDPLSCIGAVGAIGGIIDIAVRSISSLRSIARRLKGIDMTLTALIGELSTTKAALDYIRLWIEDHVTHDEQHYQLIMDLDTSLTNCHLLLSVVDTRITSLDVDNVDELSLASRIRLVLDDEDTEKILERLHRQVTALNVLIEAFRRHEPDLQNSVLQDRSNRDVLDKIRDDTTSLLVLYDDTSFLTQSTVSTTRSSKLSLRFTFDQELLKHKPYQNSFRALMRHKKARTSQETVRPVLAEDGHAESREIHQALVGTIPLYSTTTRVLFIGDDVEWFRLCEHLRPLMDRHPSSLDACVQELHCYFGLLRCVFVRFRNFGIRRFHYNINATALLLAMDLVRCKTHCDDPYVEFERVIASLSEQFIEIALFTSAARFRKTSIIFLLNNAENLRTMIEQASTGICSEYSGDLDEAQATKLILSRFDCLHICQRKTFSYAIEDGASTAQFIATAIHETLEESEEGRTNEFKHETSSVMKVHPISKVKVQKNRDFSLISAAGAYWDWFLKEGERAGQP